MEESFDLIAQTRANYYTPGSPVQFVRVELLRGSQSGDNAVCLTFKNISQIALTALDVMFKCKNAAGEVLCEDSFEYRDLNVQPGELFGMDDAVFITQEPIASVDVVLKNVYNGQRVVHLENIKRVRLPSPRRLPDDLQAALSKHMGRRGLRYAPQVLDNGWYCACGAFHPKEEDTVYCSECGSDRILLQNALNTLMQPPEKPAQPEPATIVADEPTRIAANAEFKAEQAGPEDGGTHSFEPVQQRGAEQAAPVQEEEETKFRPAPVKPSYPVPQPAVPEELEEPDEEDEEDDLQDVVAENIIRWVPPLTALICAAIALSGFVYCRFIL